jgi:hypothetical protein
MAGFERLEAGGGQMTSNCCPRDDAVSGKAGTGNGSGHRPCGLACGDDQSRRRAFENAARERIADETRRVRSVNRRTENVVEIGPKSLKRTAQ